MKLRTEKPQKNKVKNEEKIGIMKILKKEIEGNRRNFLKLKSIEKQSRRQRR